LNVAGSLNVAVVVECCSGRAENQRQRRSAPPTSTARA